MRQLEGHYSKRALSRVLGVPRSSYYYKAVRTEESSAWEAVRECAGRYPKYGHRRIANQLARAGQRINKKRVLRVMHVLDIVLKRKRRKVRTTNSAHSYPRYPNLVKNRRALFPDEIWVADITYVWLRHEHVYLAVIMDMHTRMIRGWALSRNIDVALTTEALRMAMADGRVPRIHHSDQGMQYAATAYTAVLKSHSIAISMATVGQPRENGYAERLMRTIKEEHVELTEYIDMRDALRQIGWFLMDVYTTERIHSALGYLTPAEYEKAWVAAHAGEHDTLNHP
jgi:putative transposase